VKLKLDENLPRSAAPRLAALGYDVDTVLDEELGGRSDGEVWAAAEGEERFLVTCDLDFSDTRTFVPGSHAGVLLVRLPDSEQWRAVDHLVAWFSDSDARSWTGSQRATMRGIDTVLGRESRPPPSPFARTRRYVPGTKALDLVRHMNDIAVEAGAPAVATIARCRRPGPTPAGHLRAERRIRYS